MAEILYKVLFTPNDDTRYHMEQMEQIMTDGYGGTHYIKSGPIAPYTAVSKDMLTMEEAETFILRNAGTSEKQAQYKIEPMTEAETKCACHGCDNFRTETENSPYMNEYCDDCTYERHDLPQERNPHLPM